MTHSHPHLAGSRGSVLYGGWLVLLIPALFTHFSQEFLDRRWEATPPPPCPDTRGRAPAPPFVRDARVLRARALASSEAWTQGVALPILSLGLAIPGSLRVWRDTACKCARSWANAIQGAIITRVWFWIRFPRVGSIGLMTLEHRVLANIAKKDRRAFQDGLLKRSSEDRRGLSAMPRKIEEASSDPEMKPRRGIAEVQGFFMHLVTPRRSP